MNFNTIYGNGCSFMWGHHHNNPWYFKYFEETNNIDISKFEEEAKNHSWQKENTQYTNPNVFEPFNQFDWVREKYNYLNRICEEFNFLCVNESMFGGSFSRVFRKTLKYITETNENDLEKTLFVLEIPPVGRNEMYFCNQNRYCSFAGNQNFDSIENENFKLIENWYDKSFDLRIEIISELQKLYSLINILKSKNLKFCFVQTEKRLDILYPTDKLSNEEYVSKYEKYMKPSAARKIQKEIDDNSVKFDMNDTDFTYDMVHWVSNIKKKAKFSDNTDGISFDGHPSFIGSKLISQKVIEHIKNNF